MSSVVPAFKTIDVLVDISGSTTLSLTVHEPDYQEAVFQTPAAMTSTGVEFQVSTDGTTFGIVTTVAAYAAIASKTIAVDRTYPIPEEVLMAPYWRFKMGTAEVADRTLKVFLKGAK